MNWRRWSPPHLADHREHVHIPLDYDAPCHFCGGPTPCECTAECSVCGHIGHEHSADGTCRGTNYDVTWPENKPVEEPCEPHAFVPVSVRPLP